MKLIVIKTQDEFDKIKEIKADEEVTIKNSVILNSIIEVFGILKIKCDIKSSWNNKYFVLRENASAELWGNASAVLWENASAELWENASAVLRGNARAEFRENARAELWENARAELRGNASAELRENASAVLRENASAVLWGNSFIRIADLFFQGFLTLWGYSIAVVPFNIKIKITKKSKTAIIQRYKPIDNWFERNGIKKSKKVIFYKKVSKDFKTQENTKNKTVWEIGSIVEHPNWNPKESECGEGKFHACSRPYFCDEFRNELEDKYIAVEIDRKDLYEWKDKPSYPYKIGFRKGKVLYEVNKYGEEIK